MATRERERQRGERERQERDPWRMSHRFQNPDGTELNTWEIPNSNHCQRTKEDTRGDFWSLEKVGREDDKSLLEGKARLFCSLSFSFSTRLPRPKFYIPAYVDGISDRIPLLCCFPRRPDKAAALTTQLQFVFRLDQTGRAKCRDGDRRTRRVLIDLYTCTYYTLLSLSLSLSPLARSLAFNGSSVMASKPPSNWPPPPFPSLSSTQTHPMHP